MNTFTKGLFAFVALLAMASCGGGSDVAGGGIGGTGISQGPITGFGSVFVNGVEFHTTGAEIEIEDTLNQSEDKLHTGMVVRVEWEKNASGTNYTARRIVYSDDVQGPVSDLTLTGSAFTVLGRTVTVTRLTVFDGWFTGLPGLNPLANGQVVEVSGLIGVNGNIQATRIELKDSSLALEFEIKGVVSGFDGVAKTFNVAGVAVDYSRAVPVTGLGDDVCVEVEVKGDLGSVVPGSPLFPTEIKLDDSCTAGGAEGQEVQIEGLIAGFTSAASQFTVNGQTVRVTSETAYDNDTSLILGNNAKVEVEGALSSGVLIAKKISFRREGALKIEGMVTRVDAVNKTVTLLDADAGAVTVNNLTLFNDGLRNLGSIQMNNGLKIHYYMQDGTGIATHIEKD